MNQNEGSGGKDSQALQDNKDEDAIVNIVSAKCSHTENLFNMEQRGHHTHQFAFVLVLQDQS